MNKINQANINNIVADKWFVGRAVKGSGRGKTLGFPTINLTTDQFNNVAMKQWNKIEMGVYLCQIKIDDQIYKGLLHYGPKPTFGYSRPGLEIHVLDFNKEIKKGEKIQFKLLKYLRKIKKFKTGNALINQIKKDILLQFHIF